MATSPADKWRPVFPNADPPAWIAFVAGPRRTVRVLSSVELPEPSLLWLAEWLRYYQPRQPTASASYVYLALARTILDGTPDGETWQRGVQGSGSGDCYGEPPGAEPSTIAEILSRAVSELEHRTQTGEP
jgi:hypothetical protein